MGRQNRPGGGVRHFGTWTEDDDALNLDLDKFKVSEHIDFEALIDVREFVLKIEDWELPLLTKKNKVHEEKLLYKYEGVKFTDDDEVRACPSPPTLTPRPSLAVDHLHHLLEGLAYTGTGKSKGHQVLAMEDNDEDDDDAQPYLINQTLIDMIRATAQDESIKLVEPEVDEEVGED